MGAGLCVWINLRISMGDRSTSSPSTVEHFRGCALIVLLTLIVIKGLKTASWLWVTSNTKVATHLFIGDITALSPANTWVTVKSDRLNTAQDGFIRSSAAPLMMRFSQMTSSAFPVVPIKSLVFVGTSLYAGGKMSRCVWLILKPSALTSWGEV